MEYVRNDAYVCKQMVPVLGQRTLFKNSSISIQIEVCILLNHQAPNIGFMLNVETSTCTTWMCYIDGYQVHFCHFPKTNFLLLKHCVKETKSHNCGILLNRAGLIVSEYAFQPVLRARGKNASRFAGSNLLRLMEVNNLKLFQKQEETPSTGPSQRETFVLKVASNGTLFGSCEKLQVS